MATGDYTGVCFTPNITTAADLTNIATSVDVFPIWITTSATNSTEITGTATTDPWGMWTQVQGTNAGTANDTTWVTWNSTTGETTFTPQVLHVGSTRREETEEEREARLERTRIAREQAEEKRQAQAEAAERARDLFRDLVNPAQFKVFEKRGYHEIVGVSGRRYRLRPGRTIDVMAENFGDKISHRLCIHHPYGANIPKMDTLIHQMLLIHSGEEGESELQRIANRNAA